MKGRLKEVVAPAYLLACLLLGGSSQGIWAAMVLQLGGLVLLAWAALTKQPEQLSRAAKQLWLLVAACITLVVVQLIPLPPSIWAALPGRQSVANGFALLGDPPPWLPLSSTPHATVSCLLALIPPVALLAAILRLGAYRSSYLAAAVLSGTLLGIVLGAVQVTTGSGYLFRRASEGLAAGFFANANYMGTLLLAATPFVAAVVSRARHDKRNARKYSGRIGIAASIFLLVLIGLALSRSLAAALLLLPVVFASAFIILPQGRLARPALLMGSAIFAVLALLMMSTLPAFNQAENETSVSERRAIYQTSLAAAAKVMPLGSGFGSFVPVFAREEDASTVERTYVNHAHNDYLELAMEGGVPAVVLLLAGLIWWARQSWLAWRSPEAGSFAKAAAIASAAILLHSAVDFPSRMFAISAVLATCFALLAEPIKRRSKPALGRPAKHLTL